MCCVGGSSALGRFFFCAASFFIHGLYHFLYPFHCILTCISNFISKIEKPCLQNFAEKRDRAIIYRCQKGVRLPKFTCLVCLPRVPTSTLPKVCWIAKSTFGNILPSTNFWHDRAKRVSHCQNSNVCNVCHEFQRRRCQKCVRLPKVNFWQYRTKHELLASCQKFVLRVQKQILLITSPPRTSTP